MWWMARQFCFVWVAAIAWARETSSDQASNPKQLPEGSDLVLSQVASTRRSLATLDSEHNRAEESSAVVTGLAMLGSWLKPAFRSLLMLLPSGSQKERDFDWDFADDATSAHHGQGHKQKRTNIGKGHWTSTILPGHDIKRANIMVPKHDIDSTICNLTNSSLRVLIVILLGIAAFIVFFLLRHMQRGKSLQTRVQGNLAKIHAERRLLASNKEKAEVVEAWQEDEEDLTRGIHDINDIYGEVLTRAGHVIYDDGRREFLLQKKIVFVPESPRSERAGPRQAVVARFKYPILAKAVLADFAELLRIMKGAVVLIEGHTAGLSLRDIGDHEHNVADARAELVKATIIQFGIPQLRIVTLGLPGFLGKGEDDVVLKMVN